MDKLRMKSLDVAEDNVTKTAKLFLLFVTEHLSKNGTSN